MTAYFCNDTPKNIMTVNIYLQITSDKHSNKE